MDVLREICLCLSICLSVCLTDWLSVSVCFTNTVWISASISWNRPGNMPFNLRQELNINRNVFKNSYQICQRLSPEGLSAPRICLGGFSLPACLSANLIISVLVQLSSHPSWNRSCDHHSFVFWSLELYLSICACLWRCSYLSIGWTVWNPVAYR